MLVCVFFFNDTATTEIYTLSLHYALPIFFGCGPAALGTSAPIRLIRVPPAVIPIPDRHNGVASREPERRHSTVVAQGTGEGDSSGV